MLHKLFSVGTTIESINCGSVQAKFYASLREAKTDTPAMTIEFALFNTLANADRKKYSFIINEADQSVKGKSKKLHVTLRDDEQSSKRTSE